MFNFFIGDGYTIMKHGIGILLSREDISHYNRICNLSSSNSAVRSSLRQSALDRRDLILSAAASPHCLIKKGRHAIRS